MNDDNDEISLALIGASVILLIFAGILFGLAMNGCALLDQQIGSKTYTWSAQQVHEVKEIGQIDDCPTGQSAVALAVQLSNSGGATVTVRCQ